LMLYLNKKINGSLLFTALELTGG